MKLKFLLALLLVTFMVVLLQPQRCESKPGWGRVVRRVRRIVCRRICTTVCKYICGPYNAILGRRTCRWVCYPVCRRVCNGKKKRELNRARFENEVSDDPRLKGAFPSSLKVFDKDKDGKISREEFSITAVSHVHPDLGTKEAFMLSDKNGDHYIDCKEFKMAPLRFEKKPSC